jgi:hypothetical protein
MNRQVSTVASMAMIQATRGWEAAVLPLNYTRDPATF